MVHSLLLAGLLSLLPGGHVKAVLVSEQSAIQAGGTISLGLRMEMEPGWHVYWTNPGDAGIAPSIAWARKQGAAPDSLRWPTPDTIPVFPLMTYGYKDEVVIPFTAKVEAGASGEVVLEGQGKWLECSDICVPGRAALSLTISVAAATVADPTTKTVFEKARASMPVDDAGWTWRASVADSFIYLKGLPPKLAPAYEPIRFVPLDQGVVDNAAVQAWSDAKGEFRLKIRRDAFVHRKPDSLRGVLLHPRGWLVPASKGMRISVPLVPATASDTASPPAKAKTENGSASKGLFVALFFAFLGGLALNLMPCVLPVLSLKLLDFLKKGGKSRRHVFGHGLVFAAGTILSFLAMATVLLVLRSGGEALGWGFHMQSPRVVAMLSLLMALLALNLWGVFEPGAAFASMVGGGSSAGWIGSFLTGVTATVVATPCTAPFMGAALGYTLTRPAYETFLVFFVLGAGMASPYLVLSAFPGLTARLPKPGAWMETLKHAFGFAMAGTAAWLSWVVGRLSGPDAAGLVVGLWIVVALAAWILGIGALPHRSKAARWGARLTFSVMVAFAGAVVVLALPRSLAERPAQSGDLAYEPFREGTLAELRASGKPWFIDFTADWCLSCQVNERVALDRPEVVAAFAKSGVRLVKADWTGRDSLIANTLRDFGRQGVPFYVLSDGKTETFLPELLTPGIVIKALEFGK
jgi:thiol:disulfide interchange protein/DsbC/DsbD-like thiol-disulfide interchange protein